MIGEKIYLRILEFSDINTTQKWINDPQISAIMGYLPVKSLMQQEQWYANLINDSSRMIFAICKNDNKEHVGNVALSNIDTVSRNAQFSIFIFDEINRYSGYGTEATKLILEFGFKRLNLHKVFLRTSPNFTEAIKMYKRLGFKQEGILREHYYCDGNYQDKILFGLLKPEFSENKVRDNHE